MALRRQVRDVGGADSGSVLVLVPATVLVLVVLGAITVDFAIVHLGQRELANAAAAAANDAAVAALDADAFYGGGRLRLDDRVAAEAAEAAWARRRSDALIAGGIDGVRVEDVDGELVRVTVEAAGSVEMIFSPAIPGAARTRTVTAVSTATAVRDDAGG